MPKRVFVSSTCYDLANYRVELRTRLIELGYVPVMSEFPDFNIGTGANSYEECLRRVAECDLLILLLGERYGGMIEDDDISITHAEYRTAIEHGIARINLCKDDVWNLERLYRLNPNMKFPSEYDNGPALMDFLSEVRRLNLTGDDNWVTLFSNTVDAKEHLTKRLAAFESHHRAQSLRNETFAAGLALPVTGLGDFPKPFVENGEFRGLIVLGDSYTHGTERFQAHIGDAIAASRLIAQLDCRFPDTHAVKLDTWATQADLESSDLILIGGPNVNEVIWRLEQWDLLFVNYSRKRDVILSKVSGMEYDSRFHGVVQLLRSPFNDKNSVLVCLGHSGLGTMASILALRSAELPRLSEGNSVDPRVPARVVMGLDLDNDQWVDSVRFVE